MSAERKPLVRRPLGNANLVSRAEARAELGCSWQAVDRILARCKAIRVGRGPRYRWDDVLGRASEPDCPAQPDGPRLSLVNDDFV